MKPPGIERCEGCRDRVTSLCGASIPLRGRIIPCCCTLPRIPKTPTPPPSNYRIQVERSFDSGSAPWRQSTHTPSDMILFACIIFTNLTHDLNDFVIQRAENSRAPEVEQEYNFTDVVAGYATQIKSRHKRHHGGNHYSLGTRNGISVPDYRLINLHFPASSIFPLVTR